MSNDDQWLRDRLHRSAPVVPFDLGDVSTTIGRKRRIRALRRTIGVAVLSVVVVAGSLSGFLLLRNGFSGGVSSPSPAIHTAPVFRNGLITYVGGDREIGLFTIDPSSGQTKRLTTGDDGHPSWSPNGDLLTFERRTPNGGIGLFVLDVESGDLNRITDPGISAYRPAWSPTGEWIAFDGFGKAAGGIYLVKPDGSELHRITDDRFFAPDNPVWSPDGSTIAFTSNLQDAEGDPVDGWDGYVVNVDGSGLRNVTDTPDPEQSEIPIGWLPNGNLLVATSPNTIVSGQGTAPQQGSWIEMTPEGDVVNTVLTDPVNAPAHLQEPSVSPDGLFAVFDSADGGNQNVWTIDLETLERRQITTDGGYNASWQPVPTGQNSPTPTNPPVPSVEPTVTQGGEAVSIPGVPFDVCRPMTIPGRFADGSDTLWMFEAERVPGADCIGSEGFQYLGLGNAARVTTLSENLKDIGQGDSVSLWPYAAPDIDEDGFDEIAVGIRGTPNRGHASLVMFRVGPLPGFQDRFGIEHIAPDCGPACHPVPWLDVGRKGSVVSGLACGVAPSKHPGLTRWYVDDEEDPQRDTLQAVLWILDGSTLRSTSEAWELSGEAIASIPDGTSELCGSPTHWPSDFESYPLDG